MGNLCCATEPPPVDKTRTPPKPKPKPAEPLAPVSPVAPVTRHPRSDHAPGMRGSTGETTGLSQPAEARNSNADGQSDDGGAEDGAATSSGTPDDIDVDLSDGTLDQDAEASATDDAPTTPAAAAPVTPHGKIDVNTATPLAMTSGLKGVGPKIAAGITAARPFRTIDDLKKVKGLGAARFAGIKDLVFASPVKGLSPLAAGSSVTSGAGEDASGGASGSTAATASSAGTFSPTTTKGDSEAALAAKAAKRLAAASEAARKMTVGLGMFEKLPSRSEVMIGLQRVLVAAGGIHGHEHPDALDTDTVAVLKKGSIGVRRVVVPSRPVSVAPALLTVHDRDIQVRLPLASSAGKEEVFSARVHCVSQRELVLQLMQTAMNGAMDTTAALSVAEWILDCERKELDGRHRCLGELLRVTGVHPWHLRWFRSQGILHIQSSIDEPHLPLVAMPSSALAGSEVGFEAWCADVCGVLPRGPIVALQDASALPVRPGLRLLSWNLRDLTLSGASIVEFLDEFYAANPEQKTAGNNPTPPLPRAEVACDDPLYQPVLDLEVVRKADPGGCMIVGRDGTSINHPERPRSLAHMRRLAKMCTVMQSFDVVVAQELLDDRALPWMAKRLSVGSRSAAPSDPDSPAAAAATGADFHARCGSGQLWAAHTSPFLGRRARRHRHGILWRQDKLRMISPPQPLRNTKSFERPPMISVFQVISSGRVLIVVGVHSVYGSTPKWRSLEARSLFTVLASMFKALLAQLSGAGGKSHDADGSMSKSGSAESIGQEPSASKSKSKSKQRPQMSQVVAALAEKGVDVVAAGDFNLSWAEQCFTLGRKADGQAWMVKPKATSEASTAPKAVSDFGKSAPFVPVCVETSGTTLSGSMLDQIWLASPIAARQWTGRGGVIRLLEHPRWMLHGAGGITTGVIGAMRRAIGDATVAEEASDVLPEFLGPGAIVAGDTRKIMSAALSDHVPSWVELSGQEALAVSQQFSEATLQAIAALLQ